MSTTAKICCVDDEGRVVFFDEDAGAELELNDDGWLELETSWSGIQTICELLSTPLFDEEELSDDATKHLATKLKPLQWKDALELLEEETEPDDRSELKPFYRAFRRLVLHAARDGGGLKLEFV